MDKDEFEWDDAKSASNLHKHKIGFDEATEAFTDICAIERRDIRKNYGEERFNVIGVVYGRVLFVTFTVRNSKVRIISARKANKHEREDYYRENKKN